MEEYSLESIKNSQSEVNNDMIDRMILVTMKLGAKQRYKDEMKCIKEELEKTIILVQKWSDTGKITGVIEFNSMVH